MTDLESVAAALLALLAHDSDASVELTREGNSLQIQYRAPKQLHAQAISVQQLEHAPGGADTVLLSYLMRIDEDIRAQKRGR